ncbi:MAG: M14 family zinc carboxypeptidase [Smithella sp.]|nr:M14 family zinc carboxypeptidase [Smithella sp.]
MLKRKIILVNGCLGLCLLSFLVFPTQFYSSDAPPFNLTRYLTLLEKQFSDYGWTDLKPRDIPWEYHRTSRYKNPLMFVAFGTGSKNSILFLGGVHGDELPTVYLMFRLAQYVKDNPQLFKNQGIVIAPLLNPDGFLSKPPTRVNGSGIDINRNLPTRDWQAKAIRQWTAKGKRARYYPGAKPASEQETLFQVALIKRFKPQKILSAHSPLNLFDYDGPSSDLDSFEKWMEQVSKEANHPLKRFGYYPGSLGNYAGHERNIFTLTLELPSSDAGQSKKYFEKFQPSLLKFINLPVTGSSPNIRWVQQDSTFGDQN